MKRRERKGMTTDDKHIQLERGRREERENWKLMEERDKKERRRGGMKAGGDSYGGDIRGEETGRKRRRGKLE